MAEFKIELNGTQIVGVEQGHGAPVVFLHAGVADHRMWQPQLEAMDVGVHAIAYDQRGFGRSVSDDVQFSDIDDLLAVLDHFSIQRAVLVGCSMGGGLAAAFALIHPDRVAGLVLIASAFTGMPMIELDAQENEIDAHYQKLAAGNDLDELNQFEARVWLDGARADEGRVEGVLRDFFLDMNGLRLSHPPLNQKAARPETYTRLHEIDLPILLIAGTYDSAYHEKLNAMIAQEVPQAEARLIEQTGHLSNLEEPEQFNDLLSAYLATL